jgi:hypothetical protein
VYESLEEDLKEQAREVCLALQEKKTEVALPVTKKFEDEFSISKVEKNIHE